MKLTCLIIDDEPPAREIIKLFASEVDFLEITGECKDVTEAGSMLLTNPVDLIFLDINMPGLSGMSFYRTLVHKPAVIFTTAYPEHAAEGFELNATDYLVKPFSRERFLTAVNKVAASHRTGTEDHITVKADKKLYRVHFRDIIYLESIRDYVKVCTVENNLISADTLKHYEEILPGNLFVRIHKSYIISLQYLKYLEGNQVAIAGKKLPVGKNYRDKLKQVL